MLILTASRRDRDWSASAPHVAAHAVPVRGDEAHLDGPTGCALKRCSAARRVKPSINKDIRRVELLALEAQMRACGSLNGPHPNCDELAVVGDKALCVVTQRVPVDVQVVAARDSRNRGAVDHARGLSDGGAKPRNVAAASKQTGNHEVTHAYQA
jgi:hypothetical protein